MFDCVRRAEYCAFTGHVTAFYLVYYAKLFNLEEAEKESAALSE